MKRDCFYIKFNEEVETKFIEKSINEEVLKLKGRNYKKGLKSLLHDFRTGQIEDDFIQMIFTAVARFNLFKIPRIFNPYVKFRKHGKTITRKSLK